MSVNSEGPEDSVLWPQFLFHVSRVPQPNIELSSIILITDRNNMSRLPREDAPPAGWSRSHQNQLVSQRVGSLSEKLR